MNKKTNTGKVSTEELQQMATYLENLLNRQLERLKKYDLDGAIKLAEEADDIAARLGDNGFLSGQELPDEQKRIRQLYREIGLVVASERDEVAEKLKAIRKGIKTLEAYSRNN